MASEKMDGTISYIRQVAESLNKAADRLEAHDAGHLDHARALIALTVEVANLSDRQIDRAQ